MIKCTHCKKEIILQEEEDGTPLNYWKDLKEQIYCDDCFYKLYTEPEEKCINNYNHPNNRIQAQSRKKLIMLHEQWGG